MGWEFLGGIVGLLVIVHTWVLWRIINAIQPMFENPPPFNVRHVPPDPSAEPIHFETKDGLTLSGSLWRQDHQPSRGLVVFCCEYGGNRWSANEYCAGLRQAGFDLLAFDFRNQGDSDRMPGYQPLHWLTEYELVDVSAALHYIRHRRDLRALPLGIFGISRGGAAALVAAAQYSDVRCAACEGAFSTNQMLLHHASRWITLYVPARVVKLIPAWHIRFTLALLRWKSQRRRGTPYVNLDRWLPRLRGKPAFFIAGQRDTYVRPELAAGMCRRAGGPPENVWVVPGAKHNLARQVQPQEYDQRLVQFFSDALTCETNSQLRRTRISG